MSPEMADRLTAEKPDVSARPVLFSALIFLACVAAGAAALYAYYGVYLDGPLIPQPRSFAEPRLQTDPHGDLHRFQAEQRQDLERYAWQDRQNGLVKIPIERAMALITARGEHALDPIEGAAVEPSPVKREAPR